MTGSEHPDRRSGVDVDGGWTPAFVGQREPFKPGHDLSVKHGAYASTLKLAPRAAELADELRQVVPSYSPADETLLRTLAITLARIERASAALDAVDEAAEGNAIGAYLGDAAIPLTKLRDDLRAWVGLARRLSNDLGLSPTARARLGLDIARTEDALGRYLDEHYPEGANGA